MTVSASAVVVLSTLLLFLSLESYGQPSDTSECKIKGAGIRFRPLSAGPPRSFFLQDELPIAGRTMIPTNPEIQLLRYLPRIVVQVIDSNGDVERTRNTGVVNVTIIGTGNRYDVGSSVEIKRGEAHFDQIVISQAAADGFVRLRFTAYAPGSNAIPAPPFNEHRLDTGPIKVISGSVITNTHKLAFSVNESLVQYAGDPVPFVSGKPLKTIRVNLLTTALLISTSETTQQGLSVGVQLNRNFAPDGSPIIITGNEARLRDLDGVAVFSNLRITTTATSLPGYFLRFNMTAGGKELDFLETGDLQPFQVNARFDDSNIGFMSAADSFIYTQNQHGLIAKAGTAFPPIRIQLLDKSFYPSATQFTGLIITATCDRANLWPDGSTVGVVGGVATFDQLMFEVSDIADFDYRPFVITFTAGAQGGLDVVGKKLYTGYIEVANRRDENVTDVHSLRFDQNPFNSYFNAPNVDSQFALYNVLPRPIQIQLLDGANQLSTATGVSVKLTVQGTTLQVPQDTESFSQGIARFSSVLFKQEQDIPARLIFTVTHQNQRLRLLTGEITLSARTIPASDMRFQPFGGSTISREGIDLFATKGFPMLPIVVEVLDSAGAKKPYDSEMGITASAEGATLSNNFVRVRPGSGNAIFDSLTFVSDTPGTFIITFTAQTSTPTGVNGKTLTTGKVLMTNVVTPSFRIQFDKESSYIAFEGDSRPIQSANSGNAVIPDIVLQLVDSTGDPRNLDTSVSLEVSVTTSSGRITTTAASTQSIGVDGKVTFSGLKLINAFDPVLSFCVANKDTSKFSPADGQCVASGSMPFYEVAQDVAALKILADDPRTSNARIPSTDLKIRAPASNYSILSGEPIRLIIGVINSEGTLLGASQYKGLKIEASSDVALSGSDISTEVDDLTGLAVFNDLFISDRVPIGVTPIITFSASSTTESSQLRVPELSTGLLTIVGSGGTTTGTYVVAEILTDFATYDFATWQTSVAYLLNIETARIRQVRITPGKGNDQKDVVLTQTEDSVTSNARATWEGTRVEFMFLDPLPTSENLKSSAELADLFTNLKTSKLNDNQPVCGATSPLMLRDAYIRGANNGTCDWGIFDDQMAGARQCLESQGLDGYCQCYLPLFETIAPRCIGLAELTNLCLNILGPLAECYKDYEPIAAVCKQVEFPDAPRLVVGASGAFLMLALPPVLYLAEGSYFKKVARPQAGAGKIAKTEFIRADQEDML